MTAAVLQRTQRWSCPNCPAESVTHDASPHTRFHACRGLYGLTAPLVPAGTSCKVIAIEREDYVGSQFQFAVRPQREP